MSLRGPVQPSMLLALTLCIAIAPVRADRCVPHWSEVFRSDQPGAIQTFLTHDDDGPGPGLPALYAGGAFGVARWDGLRWTPIDGTFTWGTQEGDVRALAFFDDDGPGPNPPTLYAGGLFDRVNGMLVKNIARWDGSAWSSVAGGITGSSIRVYAMTVFDVDGPGPMQPALFVGGQFTSAGGAPATGIARWDGGVWSDVGVGVSQSGPTPAVVLSMSTFDRDQGGPELPTLIIGGFFDTAGAIPANFIAGWNGQNWSALGAGTDGPISALTTFDTDGPGPLPRALYAGGWFTQAGSVAANYVACWNGADWSQVGAGVHSPVNMLIGIEDPSAALNGLVAGWWSTGALGLAGIVRWSGSQWVPAGADLSGCLVGFIGPCQSLAAAVQVFDDDGNGPKPPEVYLGGNFRHSGEIEVRGLARWRDAWVPADNGVGDRVHSIAMYDDDGIGPNDPAIVIGGLFRSAGDARANAVARWDGEAWRPLASGITRGSGGVALVNSVLSFDPDGPGSQPPELLVGGSFDMAGLSPAANVAKWDGSDWSPLGGGTNGTVNAMVAFDEDGPGPAAAAVFVGGRFTSAGSTQADRIAKWDGAAWSDVGGGFGLSGAQVSALTTFDEDAGGPIPPALFVGGTFYNAGGVQVSNIARWDGATWSPVGGWLFGPVFALAVYDPDGPGPETADLYAAGDITSAGGNVVSRIARWDGNSWMPLGNGLNGLVFALSVFDVDGPGPNRPVLIAGGGFSFAGQTPAERVAAWDGSAWAALGGGADWSVHALGSLVGDASTGRPATLIAGGTFFLLGDIPVRRIAAWVGCLPEFILGDLNCDGVVDLADISPFALALLDLDLYVQAHPECPLAAADTNGDANIDGADIAGFVSLLLSP